MFISILHMFRATMCPSSGELLYQCDTWFMSLYVDDRLVCRLTCTLDGPDDGHMVARNMWRIEINIHKKICASIWFIYED